MAHMTVGWPPPEWLPGPGELVYRKDAALAISMWSRAVGDRTSSCVVIVSSRSCKGERVASSDPSTGGSLDGMCSGARTI